MTTAQLSSARLEFDSYMEVVETYMERGWTDGLPIIPPTPELVSACLEAAGRNPSDILATEPTKGRVITAEKVAVNAAMAGCKPEHFAIVATAVEAMSEPKFNLHAMTASTMGAASLLIVNGPVAREVGINAGISVFGPGHRANAAIGRALRLVIINATGSVSGEIDKATIGHPGKYTWCMAELEDESPWEPFHVNRGFSEEDSAVSVFAALSPIQVDNHAFQRPEEILTSFREAMFVGGVGKEQGEVVVVLCPEHVGNLERAGWTKAQVKQFLWESARRPASEWVDAGRLVYGHEPDEMIPCVNSADGISVVVAGGGAGAFSCVIPLWGGGTGSMSVTRAI